MQYLNNMNFKPIYYISLTYPDLKTSTKMIAEYISHGATALQIDMPASDPKYETPLVAEAMAKALASDSNYDTYIDALKEIASNNPSVELHLVVYPEVVEKIGFAKFVDFVKEIKAASVMIAGGDDKLSQDLINEGIIVIGRIDRMLLDEQLEEYSSLSEDRIFNFNYKRHVEIAPHDCVSFKQKIDYIRSKGVKCRIFAVEGIKNKEMMLEVKDAGANGALIGNALMNLWSNEEELWKLFDEFQNVSER